MDDKLSVEIINNDEDIDLIFTISDIIRITYENIDRDYNKWLCLYKTMDVEGEYELCFCQNNGHSKISTHDSKLSFTITKSESGNDNTIDITIPISSGLESIKQVYEFLKNNKN